MWDLHAELLSCYLKYSIAVIQIHGQGDKPLREASIHPSLQVAQSGPTTTFCKGNPIEEDLTYLCKESGRQSLNRRLARGTSDN